ncbi:hypothetical protein ABPG77_004060 [Micractinium sp. CCAP 211/92]
MWSSPKKAGSKRPERQVLLTAGYILALVATLALLLKSNVIDTAGVRIWLDSQPVPCSATASDGQLRAVSCRPAHTAAAARQRRQQRGSEADGVDEDGTLGGMPAAVGEADGGEQLLGSGEGHASDAGDSELSEERGEQAEAEMDKEAGELAAEGEEEEAEEERWARAEQQAAEEAAAARAARDQAERDEEAELAASEVEQGMQSGSQQQQPAEQQAQEANAAEARQEGAKQEASQEEAAPQGSGPSPYQQALSQCEDLQCLAAAAQQERHPGQFLFPHFFIVGWQKCATTSLFYHLAKHPGILRSHDKEPEFFSYDCDYDPEQCSRKAMKSYIKQTMLLDRALEADLRVAAVEASTHYGRNGHVLAPRLRRALPWLRVVISLREPISRAISMLAHNLDKHDTGCLTKKDVYKCLSRDLGRENYSQPLQGWLDAYPREQVYLIQYENITSGATTPSVLQDLKSYLGIDPQLPDSDLGMRNTREYHLRQKGALDKGQEAEGWPMKKWQYEALVAQVRPDAQRVADLAGEHGLADPKQWMRNWEEEWRLTLEECNDSGDCIVFPN